MVMTNTERSRLFRERHPDSRKGRYEPPSDARRAASNAHKARYYAMLKGLKTGPCVDCGGLFPPECMDFDHRADKAFTISKTPVPADRLMAEVAKCDLVCANCHRLRTFDRGAA